MKIIVGYPTPGEEVEIVNRVGVSPPVPSQVITPERLEELQEAADVVFVDHSVVDYAVHLVLATRNPKDYQLAAVAPYLSYGASPRASLGLVAAGRALALLRGRRYVLPQDVFDVAPDVLRHRLVPSYEALAESISVDQILAKVLSTIPAPRIAPSESGRPEMVPPSMQPPSPTTGPPTPWAPPIPVVGNNQQ